MWRPATTRHSVSGVDTSSPIGPQIQLQKIAATTTDSGDSPVLWPYSCGSTTCEETSSTAAKRPSVSSISDQPGSTAAAISPALPAAMNTPT